MVARRAPPDMRGTPWGWPVRQGGSALGQPTTSAVSPTVNDRCAGPLASNGAAIGPAHGANGDPCAHLAWSTP